MAEFHVDPPRHFVLVDDGVADLDDAWFVHELLHDQTYSGVRSWEYTSVT